MSMDDLKRRFVDEIKMRAYDDKYVDKNEEREILQIAIQQGISFDSARQALAHVCEHQGYVLESVVLKKIKDDIEAAMGNDGKIDEGEFNMIVAAARKALGGKKTEPVVKKTVLDLMEETGNTKVKTGWFTNWLARVKEETKSVEGLV